MQVEWTVKPKCAWLQSLCFPLCMLSFAFFNHYPRKQTHLTCINVCECLVKCVSSSKNYRSTNSNEDMTGYPGMKTNQGPYRLESEETQDNFVALTKIISLSNYQFPLQHDQRQMSPVTIKYAQVPPTEVGIIKSNTISLTYSSPHTPQAESPLSKSTCTSPFLSSQGHCLVLKFHSAEY